MRPSKLRLPERTAADDQVGLLDGVGDRLGQRAAVADAGRAAVADGVEAELVEVRRQAGLVEVIGHDPAAGGEAGLHVRLDLQAVLDRLLGEQAGGDHHRGVAGVGATGDGGDHHVAVGQLHPLVFHDRDGRVLLVLQMLGGGGLVLVLVPAASASLRRPACWTRSSTGASADQRSRRGVADSPTSS